MYTVSDFKWLEGEKHFDNEGGNVYMTACVVEEEFEDGPHIVVYRRQYNQDTCRYGKVDKEDPISARDIKALTIKPENIRAMNEILEKK